MAFPLAGALPDTALQLGRAARLPDPGAGSILELLEIGGPDAVLMQLKELPRSQREDMVRAVRDSGYPARKALEDFRDLVAEPILRAPSRPRAVRNVVSRRRP